MNKYSQTKKKKKKLELSESILQWGLRYEYYNTLLLQYPKTPHKENPKLIFVVLCAYFTQIKTQLLFSWFQVAVCPSPTQTHTHTHKNLNI